MTDALAVPTGPTRENKNRKLPWIILTIVMAGLMAALWWGYTNRETVTQFAVSSLLNEELSELLPEGTDPTYMAVRIAALMRALNQGQVDVDRLKGLGSKFREFYADKKLDADELEALLRLVEAAIEQ